MVKSVLLATIFFFLCLSKLYADVVDIEISPTQPIKGEKFLLIFKINADSQQKPYISFDPGRIEVLSKQDRGFSVSSKIVNGRVTTVRQFTYVYELVSHNPGQTHISNIKLELNGNETSISNYRVEILSQSRKADDIFILALTSKTSVYVGEGFDVNYYLYFKVPVIASEVREFPKLVKFNKRFHLPDEKPESVEYDGHVYKRILKYTARLFPEKIGRSFVDPIKLKVQYGDSSIIKGGFGLALNQYKIANVQSQKVEIEVKALPTENVPANFSGLVGEHEIELIGPKSDFAVNEAIEFKIRVKGTGALETMDAPKVFESSLLEEFDTKSELKEVDNFRAEKTFEYVYLARNSLNIKGKVLAISFFNSLNEKYEEKTVTIPDIVVTGSQEESPQKVTSPLSEDSPTDRQLPITRPSDEVFIAPEFEPDNLGSNLIKIINSTLATVLFLIIAFLIVLKRFTIKKNDELTKIFEEFQNGSATYSRFNNMITRLAIKQQDSNNINLLEYIQKSSLGEDSKIYFEYVLNTLEKNEFGSNQNDEKFQIEKAHFSELKKSILLENR